MVEKKQFYINKLEENKYVSALFDLKSVTELQEGICLRCTAPFEQSDKPNSDELLVCYSSRMLRLLSLGYFIILLLFLE